jgi:diguanylate cyclase (GGDEF)-like protein
VARYGGEEFVLVLPEASLEASARVAEKVRNDCASAPMRTSLLDCTITASFGVATLPATTTSLQGCADALLRAADAALYRSKQTGRNRVTLADAPQNAAIATE